MDGFPGDEDDDDNDPNSVFVPIIIGIDEDEPGRGDEVVVTGSGYKNGTTLTFWRDSNADGNKGAGEIELCNVNVGSSDSASCSFDVNKPPFLPGTHGNAVTPTAAPEAVSTTVTSSTPRTAGTTA